MVTEEIYASHGDRIANSIIDGIAIFLITTGISYILLYTNEFLGIESLYNSYLELSIIQDYALGYGINLLFFFTLEVTTSKTIGKFATNTVVVMSNGEKPSYETIAIRSLCRLIPFDLLSYLGTPCRGWHDSISKTYVVSVEKFNNKKELDEGLDQIGIQKI